MKNLFYGMVSDIFAPIHFVLQSAADLTAHFEGKIISSCGQYDYDEVVKNRKEKTEIFQKSTVSSVCIVALKTKSIFVNEDSRDEIAHKIEEHAAILEQQVEKLNTVKTFPKS